MEPLPGWEPPLWSPAPKADVLSLALCLLLLRSSHRALAVPSCKEEEYPVGTKCCPKCSPGYQVKQACGEVTGTLCVPCAPGTYTAHLNGLSECLQCQVCDPALGLVLRRNCSGTANTVCGCGPGHFCVLEDGDDCVECRPHSLCLPGQWVQERGSQWQDTVCAECPSGTFSPNGTLTNCQPWTKCSSKLLLEVKPGTATTDATCSWELWLLLLLSLVIFTFIGFCITVRHSRLRGYIPRRHPVQLPKRKRAEGVTTRSLQDRTEVTTEAVEETAPVLYLGNASRSQTT